MDLLNLDRVDVVADDFDLSDLLDTRPPDATLRESAEDTYDAYDLVEALMQRGGFKRVWNKLKHPRWPVGTPRAGQFMAEGQSFTVGGVEYEVAHNVGGKVYANRADGKVKNTELVAFDPKVDSDGGLTLEIAAPATPKKIVGGKGTGSNVTVVNPYVDKGSHDPSIPKPSWLNADQWKRFGKLDQENLLDLDERFGASWKEGMSKNLHDTAYDAYSTKIQSLVKKAYSAQYGSSSGNTLSLASMFGSTPDIAGTAAQREEAKVLQGDLAAIVQWDLYHRVGAPDVATFHKNGENEAFWAEMQKGNKAIFSGLSQTWHYTPGSFGPNAIATPTAIRTLLMSTTSAQPIPGSVHFPGELEVSNPNQIQIDQKTLFFGNANTSYGKKLTVQQQKWLQGVTKTPAPGTVIEQLADAMAGKGRLATPPAPANIQPVGAGGKAYSPPPAAAAAQWVGKKLPPVQTDQYKEADLGKIVAGMDVSFALTEADGVTPKLLPAKDSGFKAGDFMLGKRGTLYWVGSDPGDPTGYGLRYHEIDPASGIFNGKSFNFTGGGTSKFYRLEQHVPEPVVKSSTGSNFDASKWSQSSALEFTGKLKKGTKFKVDGNTYELVDDGNMLSNTVTIKSLANGKLNTINTDYKTPTLIRIGGESDEGEAVTAPPEPGETTGTAENVPPSMKAIETGAPVPGDFFAYMGKKYTVSSVLKDGTVRAKPLGGKVEKFEPDDPAIKGGLFRPSKWLHAPGMKKSIGSLEAGDLFDMGAGAKLRPAVVTGKQGIYVTWEDLETGAKGSTKVTKAIRAIVPKGEVSRDNEGVPPEPEAAAAEGKFSANDYSINVEPKMFGSLPVGTVVGQNGGYAKIIGQDVDAVGGKTSGKTTVKMLTPGTIGTGGALAGQVIELDQTDLGYTFDPKSDGNASYDELVPGDPVFLADLKPGDVADVGGGNYVKLIGPDQTSDGDGNIVDGYEIAFLDDNGQQTGTMVSDDSISVKLAFKASDAPKPTPTQSLFASAPTEDLPDLAQDDKFQPYASAYGSGGKYKHDKIQDMAVGTQFRDKAGNVFIVKQTGATSIVSDGVQHYKVDGQLRGRALEEKSLIDSAGPLPGEPSLQDKVNAAAAKVTTLEVPTLANGSVVSLLDAPAGTIGTVLYSDGTPSALKVQMVDDPDAPTGKGYLVLASDFAPDVGTTSLLSPGTKHMLSVESSSPTTPTPASAPAEPDTSFDSYLDDEFWPEDTPLPVPGQTVWFTKPDGTHEKGFVKSTYSDAEGDKYTLQTATSFVDVFDHDLLRPGSVVDPKMIGVVHVPVGTTVWGEEGASFKIVNDDKSSIGKGALFPDGQQLPLYVHDTVFTDAPPHAKTSKASAPPKPANSPIPSYEGVALSGNSAAGGSNGSYKATGPDGKKWLVKKYGGNEDRVATEVLANAIYRTLGAKAPEMGTTTIDGKKAITYPLVDGAPKKITSPSKELGQHYMADALLANWDFVGLSDDNVLWGPDGKPFRVDHGGTMFFRAQGGKKAFGPKPLEIESMMKPGQGQGYKKVDVTRDDLLGQAGEIKALLTPTKIDELVAAAPFASEALRDETRKALKARVSYMGDLAYGLEDFSPEFKKQVPVGSSADDGYIEPPATGPSTAPLVEPDVTPEQKAFLASLKPGDMVYDNQADPAAFTANVEVLYKSGVGVQVQDSLGQEYVLYANEIGPAKGKPKPSAPAVPVTPKAASPSTGGGAWTPDLLQPYGSAYGPGGKYKYEKLTDLKPGDKFRDKAGELFEFTANLPQATGGAAQVKRLADGKEYALPHTYVDAKGKSKPTRFRLVTS